jgi:hypothetical protein
MSELAIGVSGTGVYDIVGPFRVFGDLPAAQAARR